MFRTVTLVGATYLPAFIGLIGVAVGGVLAGLKEWVMAHQENKGDTRSASRLLAVDLHRARTVIQDSLGRGASRFIPKRADELKLKAWTDGRGKLALTLDPTAWVSVSEAVEHVEAFRRLLEHSAEHDDEEDLRTRATRASQDIDAALKHLERVT